MLTLDVSAHFYCSHNMRNKSRYKIVQIIKLFIITRHTMKKNAPKGTFLYCKLMVILIIIMSIFTKESACSEDSNNTNDTQKKSYILAGAGALISPAIGHTYIGGDNIRRGLWYTVNETFNAFLTVEYSIASLGGGNHSYYRAKSYGVMTIATHTISAIDALISVRKINTNSPTKSYFIATAGSALFPINAIGHGYLGQKNHTRGWFYTFGYIILSAQAPDNSEIRNAIRYISMLDAFGSTYKYNTSLTKVTILPEKSSLKLMITRTF